jgi:prepilin-type N-terminal cleavage/methylation domain-containing protein
MRKRVFRFAKLARKNFEHILELKFFAVHVETKFLARTVNNLSTSELFFSKGGFVGLVRTVKSQAGFSLIELMLVVAIIGILAVVVIPNFTRYSAKARAAESKTQLAALFVAEKAFHAEFNSYHTDAANIGYRPTGSLRYAIGFNTPSTHTVAEWTSPIPLTPTDSNTLLPNVCSAGCTNLAQTSAGVAITAVSLATTATMTTFSAAAEGFVGGTTNDIWSIDENRTVLNNSPGGY